MPVQSLYSTGKNRTILLLKRRYLEALLIRTCIYCSGCSSINSSRWENHSTMVSAPELKTVCPSRYFGKRWKHLLLSIQKVLKSIYNPEFFTDLTSTAPILNWSHEMMNSSRTHAVKVFEETLSLPKCWDDQQNKSNVLYLPHTPKMSASQEAPPFICYDQIVGQPSLFPRSLSQFIWRGPTYQDERCPFITYPTAAQTPIQTILLIISSS